jgi:hypothetical protein
MTRIPSLHILSIAIFLTFAIYSSNLVLQAKDVPSDACALLSNTQLAKVLAQPYSAPAKTIAPAAQDRVTGTDCTYQTAKGVAHKVLFRIYVDPSTAVAKETFTQLSAYYAPNTATPGIGDTAYLDSQHAIHVQKGKVRFYINLSPVGTDTAQVDKQLKSLATWVAGQI